MCKGSLAMLVAGLVGVVSCTQVRADDTIRLGTSGSPGISGATDTQLVYHRGGYVGYRGYYGGFRGFYGGYRFYRPYWAGYGPYVYARPYVYRPYVYAPYVAPVYYTTPTYYYPLSAQVNISAPVARQPVTTVQYYPSATPNSQRLPLPTPVQPGPAGNPTYPYDGGPNSPVPLPAPSGNDEGVEPMSGPRPLIPLSGKVVSLPHEATGGTTQYTTQLVSLHSTTQPAVPTYTYPAYGEVPLPPVRRQAK